MSVSLREKVVHIVLSAMRHRSHPLRETKTAIKFLEGQRLFDLLALEACATVWEIAGLLLGVHCGLLCNDKSERALSAKFT